MKIFEKECKSIMTKSKLPDADYVINPYIGCCHSCAYCYAQFMRRFTGHADDPWGSFMDIKTGGKIPAKNLQGKTILIGSVTDPYNPLEHKYKATRNILERLAITDTGAAIEILTKSPLVLRDIDILRNFTAVCVGISLATMDSVFSRRIEKYAPLPQDRINAVKELKQNGIQTYLFASPIFPLFQDWKNTVNAADEYADMFCFENLNLRANYRKDVFEIIQEFYPDKFPAFKSLFENPQKLREYWINEAAEIKKYMSGRPHKLYFFHSEIKKK